MSGFPVTVRDGRTGRDPSLVTDGGGEILTKLEMDHPPEIGEQLALPDGTVVRVIGVDMHFVAGAMGMVAHVGEL